MELVLVQVEEVVVAVSIFVRVNPLVWISWSPVAFVRPTVAITIKAPVAVFGGRACRGWTSIRLVSGGWVVAKAVTVGVVPLGSFGWEGVNDAVSLVGGVVAIVVLINVSVPVVNALIVSAMSGHDMAGVGAPSRAINRSAVVVVARTATPWARSVKGVHLIAGVRVVHARRGAIGTVPIHAGDNLRAIG